MQTWEPISSSGIFDQEPNVLPAAMWHIEALKLSLIALLKFVLLVASYKRYWFALLEFVPRVAAYKRSWFALLVFVPCVAFYKRSWFAL
ncbi:hypothetical protein E2C01_003266 [Portunus trituberculatus]|uniref:Uncharacterized protein n=1 Tax=Portunus trituberculatus TaxID=210409 RepID=A0A5B7CM53_PORTR|nr:hypothetical protein [Portunus trituberculatus]